MGEDRVFRGRDQGGFAAYIAALEAEPGGTVSPGGAALILGYTRQHVWHLVNTGEVRAWQFFEDWSVKPDYVELSVRDLVRYGVRRGRIKSYRDCHMGSTLLKEEVERALAELKSVPRNMTPVR